MRINIDLRKCQGFGMCQDAAPLLFRVDERDGYSVALVSEVPLDAQDAAHQAAGACPMSAITLE